MELLIIPFPVYHIDTDKKTYHWGGKPPFVLPQI